jgi:endonuclease YncB( thermonuclease family)
VTGPAATDWEVEGIVRVVDGDTVRIVRERTERIDGLEQTTRDIADPDGDGRVDGVSVRLVNLDTPERGEPGYSAAKADLARWLEEHQATMRVRTYGATGGFDRVLGDFYVPGPDGVDLDTASQWMIRERGWLPYVKGQ